MARYCEVQRTRRSVGEARTAKKSQRSEALTLEHTREIVALVLLALAAFLIFSLVATDLSGVVGRAVRAGLAFAFGRLAFLVPVALVAAAVMVLLGARLGGVRLAGVLVFIFGLFLLVGGAVPPFGTHGPELFVRDEFETLAGGLGEGLYAAVNSLIGVVGVGILAWIAVLVGFSLTSGITGLWLGRRTRKAADMVRTVALRSQNRAAHEQYGDWGGEWNFPATGTIAAGGRQGEEEWTVRARPDGESRAGWESVSRDSFDDWISGRSSERERLAIEVPTRSTDTAGTLKGATGVVDGAQAFADLYRDGTGSEGHSAALLEDRRDISASEAASEEEKGGQGRTALGTEETTTSSRVVPVEQLAQAKVQPAVSAGQQRLPGLAQNLPVPADEPAYLLPEPRMLRKSVRASKAEGVAQRDIAAVLVRTLSQFGVEARVMGMVVGPRVTRYELQLAPGTKVGKVAALKDDLAYALATTDIRILTPIPGKSAVGVEVPNPHADWVTLGDIYQDFPKSASPLMFWLGKDISGKPVYADLTRLPHLLIAGTTGSGKSGCVNCIVSSILLRSTPEQVRMIMIDPKKVELSHYDRIPHLLVPVVTNMRDAAGVLQNVVKEMEDRYELMELDHARNLPELNKTRARRGERPLPYILIVIDELADLMMASPQEVEDAVIRLAQKSRAVGIHLVVATQRPSADVITGLIKANIPSRIAFAVSSQIDSRVILDVNGAETLLGQGDMLFKPLGSIHMQRIQGAYITEEEIALLVNHWRRQAQPEFREELLRRPEEPGSDEEETLDPDSDELLADAARLVIDTGNASVSMLQRRLRVGYTRAGRLIDMLERRGIVGPWEGSKPRQILVERDDIDRVLAALSVEDGSRSQRAE